MKVLINSQNNELADLLRKHDYGQKVTFEVDESGQLIKNIGLSNDPKDAIILDHTNDNTINLIKQVRSISRDLAVMVLVNNKDLKTLKTTLQLTPFLGNMNFCFGVNEINQLPEKLDDILNKLTAKREFNLLKKSVNETLANFEPSNVAQKEFILDQIMEYAPIGVCVLDEKYIIKYANVEFESIFGRSVKDLVDKPFPRLLPTKEAGKFLKSISTNSKSKEEVSKTLQYKNEDQEVLTVEYLVKEITQKNSKNYLLILNDITQKAELEQKLKDYNKSLEIEVNKRTTALNKSLHIIHEQNKHLEQFVYVASHDLQEPLRTISSYIQLLEMRYSSKLDPTAKRFMEFISEGADRMRILIKGLLDHSRIGRKKSKTDISTKKLVDEVILDLGKTIADNNVSVSCGKLPIVPGFEMDLRLLFQNLISNAIKFQRKGVTPTIKISARLKENKWVFAIKDNGIGIEKKYSDKVFEIFQRLHTKRHYEGTGIGLAHCKKIVEMHEGNIWVKSELGKGSTFYFTIPKI